eukprot:scaffold982_cov139-Cylindrotheca_fusiformis.AAC.23
MGVNTREVVRSNARNHPDIRPFAQRTMLVSTTAQQTTTTSQVFISTIARFGGLNERYREK